MKDKTNGKKRKSCLGTILKFLILLAIPLIILGVYLKFFRTPEKEEATPEKVVTDTEGEASEEGEASDPDSITFKVQKNEYDILVLGYDKTDNITNVVLVVNINDNDGTLRILQIPADTYFNLNSESDSYDNKVSNIFAARYDYYSAEGKKNGEATKKALEDTKNLLSDGLFVTINHAVLVDADGFGDIVDSSLEGVDVNIGEPITYFDADRESEVTVPEGKQTLNGDTVKALIMLYGSDGVDLDRIILQKNVINAFVGKVQTTMTNVIKLTAFVKEIVESLTTDMSMEEMLTFMTNMLKYGDMSTVTVTLPSQICGDSLVMNRAAALELINRYFNTYDKEIPLKYFDQKGYFCDKADEEAVEIYSASPDDLTSDSGFVLDRVK
ncbi:MAG: LCP family protein [Clostridia bacterium]|nr:LCP family protein [Clostridia bacterium]